MKYCTKCGNEMLDEEVVCPKCGCKALATVTVSAKSSKAKEKLFTGHLLNILSFIIPATMIILCIVLANTGFLNDSQTSSSDSGISVSIGSYISSNGLSVALDAGILIFILGIIIYFIKRRNIKIVLSYVYLISAIADFVLFLIVWMGYIISTCFIGSVALVPGIMQIIAGTKFITGSKYYER